MTRRAFALAMLCSLALGVITPYSDLVLKGTWIGLTSFPISALMVLTLFVAAINVPLRRWGHGLTTAELLVIYATALVTAGIPTFGWTGLLIPYLAGPFYFATPENKYASTLLPNLPSWFHPHSQYAITKLYEGLRPGETIPWGEWIVPLAAATALGVGLFACYFALVALLRRRWIDEEKLVFPLMELPGQLADYSDGRALLPSLLTNKIMWIFFALPFFIYTMNGLHFYFPSFPQLNVNLISLDTYVMTRPWRALSPFWLRIFFSIIGLAYILPSEVSLSLWVFYFFFMIQQVIGDAAGMPMPLVQAYPVHRFVAEQMIGGIIAFGVLDVIASKGVWEVVWRRMIGGGGSSQSGSSQSGEAMSWGVAGWLMVGGLAAMGIWGSVAGAGFLPTLGLMVLYLLLHLVAVRLVSQAGMLSIQHPYRPFNIYLDAWGTAGFGPKQITMLSFLDSFIMLDNRSPTMPGIMQSFKLVDRAGVNRSGLMVCLAVAIGVAMLSSYVSYLYLMYRYGGATLQPWFTSYYARNLFGDWTTHLLIDGQAAQPQSFVLMGVGAATMGVLLHLHHHFTWWPLSPVGYLMGASWPMINFWFPIFVGWLIKSIILHYGGVKAYRQLLPGFLGWILAEFLSGGGWVIIDMICGVRGHQIFTF